jgi:hypothetical protein
MTTLLFVHGTGVRKTAYDETLAAIRAQVKDWPGVQLEGCLWGDDHGVRLHAGGASVPTYEATRAVDEGAALDPELARWTLLYRDSLGELRLLAIAAGPPPAVPVGGEPGQELLDEVDAFDRPGRLAPRLHELLVTAGLREAFDDARGWVIAQAACRDALRGATDPFSEYRYAVARAVVAEAIACRRAAGHDPDVGLDVGLRDELVDEIVAELGHGDRGLAGRLGRHAWQLAIAVGAPAVSGLGTFGASFHRGRLTDAAALQIGDILLYQARGEAIRGAIAGAIRAAAPPVVVVAHSLGGIAAVDLLALDGAARRGVARLVTVGSQAPFLYELGALVSLPYGRGLPPDFPPWLNLYDLNDYLSYVGNARGLFGDRVIDKQIMSGQPFPAAHGAYWKNRDPDQVWDAIRGFLP